MTPSNSKVFLNTLKEIRDIIQNDQLVPGDKIPSERELAERLSVGRSSVREALRALELLGIIETRRGEGTFLKNVHENHLIPLLGTFILQEANTKNDLLEMNEMLEMNALMLILRKRPKKELYDLKSRMNEAHVQSIMAHLLLLADNKLLFKIWTVLNQYVRSVLPANNHVSKDLFGKLIDKLMEEDQQSVMEVYKQLSSKTV
ncbi:GntR family transcriptional regulator [Bacillus sp. FJAT-47783]|uniref:FadR/GntR family transcriptional regulator n=1 Tax=Bacillus sp. FJAT-47783 TaxID=2922712 RepID=UPI001FACD51D